jgi:hypothetical protein
LLRFRPCLPATQGAKIAARLLPKTFSEKLNFPIDTGLFTQRGLAKFSRFAEINTPNEGRIAKG